MIPKVIHYCWFGKKDKPQDVQDYIATWRLHCPDYIIKEWNEDNFDVTMFQYTKQAYELGKYAFVSDVCRLYALQEGGIYLDTDIEVRSSFTPFLNEKSFLGEEQKGRCIGTGVIGASANTQWIKDFLDLYKSIMFENNGVIDIEPNTSRITRFFRDYPIEQKPKVYPVDFFCAKDFKSKRIIITENTVCIHHYAASWVTPSWYQIYEKKFWDTLHLRNFNILGKIDWKIIRPISNCLKNK